MDGNAVRQENQSRRVAMVFEKDSKEFQLILPMMVKLQGKLHISLSMLKNMFMSKEQFKS